MQLNDLSLLIENEIHATHSISDETYQKILDVINEVEHIHEPLNVRDSRLKLVLSLNPLSFKMFQYIVAAMEKVIPEPKEKVIEHVSNAIIVKAFKYFPKNTDVYMAYVMRKIIDDRDGFLKECMEDKVINVDNKSTFTGNYLAWIMFIFIVIVFVNAGAKMYRRIVTYDEREKIRNEKLNEGIEQNINNINGEPNTGSDTKSVKHELRSKIKELKKELKKLKK